MTPPRWFSDHHLLASVARHLHAQRAAYYPRLVVESRLSRAKALDGLRIMRTIARSWRAIAELRPEPVGAQDPDQGGAWPFERVQHLTVAARHARAQADAAEGNVQAADLADAIETLLWWETARPSARWLVDTTIAGRRQANACPIAMADRAALARRIEQRRVADARKTRPLGVAA